MQPTQFRCFAVQFLSVMYSKTAELGYLRGTEVERRFLASGLSLSCARPAADG